MKRLLGIFASFLTLCVALWSAPPTVNPDAYSLDEDFPLFVPAASGVLSNDLANGNAPLQSLMAINPEHGRLVLDWDGGFKFYPQTNYFGPDGFSYFSRKALVFGLNNNKSSLGIAVTVRVEQPPISPFYDNPQTQTSTTKLDGFIVGNLLPRTTTGPFTNFQTLGFDITNTTQCKFTFTFHTTVFFVPVVVAETIITVPPGGLRMRLSEPPAPGQIIASKFDQTNVLTAFDVKGSSRDSRRTPSGDWIVTESSVNLGGTVLPLTFTNNVLTSNGTTNTLKMPVAFALTNVLVDEATMTFADVVVTGMIEGAAAAIDNTGETSQTTFVSLVINAGDDPPIGVQDTYISLQAAPLVQESNASTNAEPLILPGSAWSYLYTSNAALIGNWRAWNYDDSSWNSGAAALGFGTNSIVTDIRGGGPSNIATAYFRRDFYVEDLSDSVPDILLSLRRDDAAAIYVNGVQVYRDANLPANATNTTFVTGSPITGALENAFISIPLNATNLFEGWNVLAAEVHNYKPGSNPPDADIRFDCGLYRTRTAGVMNNDWDIDTPSSNLNAVVLVPPERGTLGLNPDGSFSYMPESGFTGTVSFAYKLLDRAPPGDVRQVLVSTGGVWRMLYDGTEPGNLWTSNGFADAGWRKGYAEIGYGDEAEGRPETTNVRTDTNGTVYAAYYFRQNFYSSLDTLFVTNLVGRILRDDAAAIYLNGAEVYRDTNLVADATRITLATSETPSETEFQEFSVSPSLLRQGTNTVAVEIHQASTAKSEDLSFDFELIASVYSGARVTISVLPDDIDGDLVSDTYERRYGYNYNDPSDAVRDDDLDGLTTRMEFTEDTNPRDHSSYLHSTSTVMQGTNAVLTFEGISPDRTYRLQSSTDLRQWVDVGDPIPGSSIGNSLNVSLAPGEPRRFYRLQVLHVFP